MERYLNERLENCEARLAIMALIHRYAANVCQRRGSENAQLFTSGGSFEVRDADPSRKHASAARHRVIGGKDLRTYFEKTEQVPIVILPMIHNIDISIDGDRARSWSLMRSASFPAGNEVIGEYDDAFQRVDTEWYFASRVYTIFSEGYVAE